MNKTTIPDSVWRRYTARGTPFTGNREHATILIDSLERGGVGRWNRWRKRAPRIAPNLSGMGLAGRDLSRADFHGTNLRDATMARASLWRADLRDARLTDVNLFMANLFQVKAAGADFRGAHLRSAVLSGADCRGCHFDMWTDLTHAKLYSAVFKSSKMRATDFSNADLTGANFDGADLRKAELNGAVLDGTSLRGTRLNGAELMAAFIRGVRTDEKTEQKSLVVDFNLWSAKRGWISFDEPTVNDIQVAQFYNVVSEHGSIAKFIAAGSMSVVLILGRFTPKRKRVLDGLAWALRARGKSAVVFDFPSPENREISDTVRFVAALSEFIVVDLTAPSSVPLEMQSFIPDLMVPVVSIIEFGHRPFAMFADLQRRYYWLLPPRSYRSGKHLIQHVDSAIVNRARKASREIERRRRLPLSSFPSVGK
jgi:uncharacterized protein YjbI with pentapeptide repeats